MRVARLWAFVTAAALQAPRSTKKLDTKNRIMFTRISKSDDDHKTKFETMSETYLDKNSPMGDFFEKMWMTNTSPVFFSDYRTRRRDEEQNARVQDVCIE